MSQHPCEFVLDELVGGEAGRIGFSTAHMSSQSGSMPFLLPRPKIPKRALFRHEKGPRRPLTLGRIRSLGMRQSWRRPIHS